MSNGESFNGRNYNFFRNFFDEDGKKIAMEELSEPGFEVYIKDLHDFSVAFSQKDHEKLRNILSTTNLKYHTLGTDKEISPDVYITHDYLLLAARRHDIETCKILLETGNYNPNMLNSYGDSAFTQSYSDDKILLFLFEHGGRVPGFEDRSSANLDEIKLEILNYNFKKLDKCDALGRKVLIQKINKLMRKNNLSRYNDPKVILKPPTSKSLYVTPSKRRSQQNEANGPPWMLAKRQS